MSEIATTEPESKIAGDTWKWNRADLVSDYPASTWTLTYYFTNTSANFAIVATASGESFAISVAAATTAAYTAGVYHWQAFVDDGTDRYFVDSGTMEVLPDLAEAGSVDRRTHAEKTLDAIEAVIEARATKDQSSYTIEGRTLERTPIADLIKLRDRYRAEVIRQKRIERINRGQDPGGRSKVRF